MKCEDTSEFVSALYDGELIPPSAAEHIGQCVACRDRMSQYAKMGAELRRLASLDLNSQVPVREWEKETRSTNSWWGKGWETMRVPRFAFALLIVAVVVMGSNIVLGRVRAHTSGGMLMLVAKPTEGHTVLCKLSTGSKSDYCRDVQTEGDKEGRGIYTLRILSVEGKSIQLGIRAARVYHKVSDDEVNKFPESAYWFTPGESLHIDVPGAGDMSIEGELWDHYPSPGELWDHMQSLANCR